MPPSFQLVTIAESDFFNFFAKQQKGLIYYLSGANLTRTTATRAEAVKGNQTTEQSASIVPTAKEIHNL